jgi:mannitol 2-dehydrogenase
MTHLANATLQTLDDRIRRPSYNRGQLKPRSIHIGVGSFHRAHQAVYLDELLERGACPDWGECGMGVLPQDAAMRDALRAQDYLYTVVERSAEGQTARVIGSIVDFSLAPEKPAAAIERLAGEEICLVSMTITEGGYFIHEGTGEFDPENPQIQHDILHPGDPRTTLGYLAAALKLRRDRNIAPFTVMSCDNLQGNGDVIRKVLLGLTQMQDPELHRWISANIAFPNSMVDRITPATTAEDREHLKSHFGIEDARPIVTEPFMQWVIEDKFCNARPPWQEVGAEIVTDVLPFEVMKMRLLNASHTTMAYLGALAGFTFANELMLDPTFNTLIEAFMNEATPIVPLLPNTSIPAYKAVLMQRFANPTINDRLARLCSEGTAKLPKWTLPSIVELSQQQRPSHLHMLVVAAWIKYLQATRDEKGRPIEVVDARAAELKQMVRPIGKDPLPFLANTSIFGSAYFTSKTFVQQVADAMQSITDHGVAQTVRRYTTASRGASR